MPEYRCPHCGRDINSDDPHAVEAHLSPSAWYILNHAPRRFLNGTIVPIRVLASATGYSRSQVGRALRELAEHGYVEGVRRGSRYRYRGVPGAVG